MKRSIVVLAVLLSTPVLADEAPKKFVAFNADARVELDAQGKVLRVQAASDLPEGVRTYIEKRVAAWTFAPPRRGDANASAASYLRLGACAIPTASGYRMGLDLKDTGPRPTNAGGWSSLDVRGMASVTGRMQWTGAILVHYIVDKDGDARIESVDIKDPRVRRALSGVLDKAIGGMHFAPEEFDGHAVATRQTLEFDVRLSGSPADAQAELIADAKRSPECVAAGTEAPAPAIVTIDSVVRVLDAG